jgi:hypothetical protein
MSLAVNAALLGGDSGLGFLAGLRPTRSGTN